jgi:hypothetical protein
MATANGRTAEQVRLDIEAEREGLAAALEDVRAGVDVNARLRGKIPAATAGALALGFVVAGGIQATVRLLKGPSQEDRTKRFGPFSFGDRD